VRAIAPETPRAATLTFDVEDWPGHRAGQHVDVRLTAEDGYQAERSYSIASAPELTAVEITVELIEDGEVSPWFAKVAQPGDMLEVRGPIGGHFSWSADEGGPLLLVAGGYGLAPLMAMLRHRAARASDADVRVLVSARAADDVPYRDELASLDADAALRIAYTYTRAAPPGWTGWARRVDAAMLDELSPGPAARCFVCGPTPFVEHVNELLVASGHDPSAIHAERFGPTGG
jgi:ferredoxin-NADP reductase